MYSIQLCIEIKEVSSMISWVIFRTLVRKIRQRLQADNPGNTFLFLLGLSGLKGKKAAWKACR
jgi:hypothetical protein